VVSAEVATRNTGVESLTIAKLPDATTVAASTLPQPDGSGRAIAPMILASAELPTAMSSATHVPEQRFAQQASALLVLMQLEKTPLLPDRSQINERDEQRKSAQDGNVVRA
jgi:hypothetical protein